MDYYNQTFDIKVDDDSSSSTRLVGNLFQNNSWEVFATHNVDRLKHLDLRNDRQFEASPVEFFGFNVRLPQSYYEHIYKIKDELTKNLTDAQTEYVDYKGRYDAAVSTKSIDDDKALAVRGMDVNSYKAVKEAYYNIEKDG